MDIGKQLEKAKAYEELKKRVMRYLLPEESEVFEKKVKGKKIIFRKGDRLSVTLLRDIICYNYLHLLDNLQLITDEELDKTYNDIIKNHIRF